MGVPKFVQFITDLIINASVSVGWLQNYDMGNDMENGWKSPFPSIEKNWLFFQVAGGFWTHLVVDGEPLG